MSIPAVAHVLREGLELPTGVTLLVGENGSGKSTLVEAFGPAAEGGTRNVQEGTRATESPLHRWITLERSPGAARWGFFLRAETMHGYHATGWAGRCHNGTQRATRTGDLDGGTKTGRAGRLIATMSRPQGQERQQPRNRRTRSGCAFGISSPSA